MTIERRLEMRAKKTSRWAQGLSIKKWKHPGEPNMTDVNGRRYRVYFKRPHESKDL